MTEKQRYDYIEKFIVDAVLTEPMHVGAADNGNNDILIHPVDDVPFIQASGITGVFRSYITERYGEKKANELFGGPKVQNADSKSRGQQEPGITDAGSRIKITDGVFGNNSGIELRPRVSINPETGSVAESKIKGSGKNAGHKFEMTYIGAGASFSFSIYAYGKRPSGENKSDNYKYILEMLEAAENGLIQFGGQKSNGCGYVHVNKVLYKAFEMRNYRDLKQWMREETLSAADYIPIKGLKKGNHKPAFTITVKGRTEGAILVKAIAVPEVGKDAPKSVNIKNAKLDYIVPASSFKGAVRNQMELIVENLKRQGDADVDDLIWNSFGGFQNPEDDQAKQKTGNMRFFDTVIGSREENDRAPLSHRIHIDKFTGGVFNGGLFSEKNAGGKITLNINILDNGEPEKTCAVAALALRNLANGLFNIGSGYSIGKGFIKVSTISIRSSDKEAIMDFNTNKVLDKDKLLRNCLLSLKRKEEAQ